MIRWLASATSRRRPPPPRAPPRRCREVVLDLLVGQLVERPRVEALVAVGHVDRQQPGRCRASAAPSGPSTRRPAEPTAASTHGAPGSRSWQSRCTSWPARTSAAAEPRVVDVGAGPVQQVAVEDEDAHGAHADQAVARLRAMTGQMYRMRTPSTGREVFLEAEPDRVYVDRETGEPMEVVGKVLPPRRRSHELPWSPENLRFCNWCDQLAQKDLNDCPTCGRRMAALPR